MLPWVPSAHPHTCCLLAKLAGAEQDWLCAWSVCGTRARRSCHPGVVPLGPNTMNPNKHAAMLHPSRRVCSHDVGRSSALLYSSSCCATHHHIAANPTLTDPAGQGGKDCLPQQDHRCCQPRPKRASACQAPEGDCMLCHAMRCQAIQMQQTRAQLSSARSS